jgi:uncharacterized membrane protein
MSEAPSADSSPDAVAKLEEPALADRGRFLPVAKIAVFDVAGPLVVYFVLRSAGLSTVTALVLSAILPALGVAFGMARDRRVDIIGVLVLIGIAVGTGLGLATGDARLVLLEGSVPTAVFGVVCLGSLWTGRPLMYRFAVDFIGADTPKGRDFMDRWRYPDFRHAFRLTTAVWGGAFLAEAVARIVIVESTSTGAALGISKAMSYVVLTILIAWNIAYGRRARRRGEARGAAARARGEVPPPMPAEHSSTARSWRATTGHRL